MARAASTTQEAPVDTVFPRGAVWKVHKFGGTCVSAADRISETGDVVVQEDGAKKMIVVSAMGSHPTSPVKVTDLILNMIDRAQKKDEAFLLDLAALQEKHISTAKHLLADDHKELNRFISGLMEDIANLKSMLQAIAIAGLATEAFSDYVVGHGELWSARLFAASLRIKGHSAVMMDARDVLVVTPTSDGQSVDVDYAASNANLDAWADEHGVPDIIVCTGFIARSPEGQVTTLRRNGSDYSATIMGALTQAGDITIWTDVDGVYSADPRKVPEAVCLETLSYHEAWELSYFGANVLHPRTTLPAMKFNIPIIIRNFFNLAAPGTRIEAYDPDHPRAELPVSGFATIDNVCLINVEGTGMVGVPGVASSIFTSLRDNGINVIMISQASSEHSVCFAVKANDGLRAARVLKERFADAIRTGRVHQVERIDSCAVLAAVGQGMESRKGVAATMFDALAKAGVNIKAIAQGSSEYNITVLIDQADAVKALRACHGRFFLSATTMNVAVVGPGLIGATLLQQLFDQNAKLKERYNLDLRVLGIASSKKMLLSETGIDLAQWRQDFEASTTAADLGALATHLRSSSLPNTVIIDCTASDGPPALYESWMRRGIHVITPNKKLGSGPLAQYQAVRELARQSYTHWSYEATVGAGLPIVATLKHLMETGDKIISVEGVFSGTLSYIFNNFGTDDRSFSQIVAEARAGGYTEPDPRDDLSGMDVARKVTILGREAGLKLEVSDVPIMSLVPDALVSGCSPDEFMQRLPEFDADMAKRAKDAAEQGMLLRYVGVVDCESGKGSVELKSFPKDHPFCQLTGTDNIIAFRTERYNMQPLIVRGPGAGAEVTAAGVFSDLLRLASHLGAPI